MIKFQQLATIIILENSNSKYTYNKKDRLKKDGPIFKYSISVDYRT
jgi:hypothetical protein